MQKPTKIIITNDYPTTIVVDFFEFLNYIEAHIVKLTKTNQQMTRKDLIALYALMTEPKLDVNEKSNQIGYPLLHLFFELALNLELIQRKAIGSTNVVVINKENMTNFKALTISEQYVSLLNCFWTKADWRELQGSRYGSVPINMDSLYEHIEKIPVNKELKVREDRDLQSLLYDYGYFLLYFSYFGFWKVVLDEEQRKSNHYKASSIVLLPLIKQLFPPLIKVFQNLDEQHGIFDKLESLLSLFDESFGFKKLQPEPNLEPSSTVSLVELLQPLFEEGQLTNILQNIEKPIIKGEYILKVALRNDCWRTIQLSEAHTLLDLHRLIQQAFEFADDHLYAFYMDNKKFSKHCYNSPKDMQGPYVHEVTIGDLHLYEGQRFLYLFDFGDEWSFSVSVIKITEGKETVEACIRQRTGQSPDQYAW